MDKKVIFIGLGVVALGGLAFLLFRKKPTAGTDAATRAADTGAGASDIYSDKGYDSSLEGELGLPQSKKEVRQERRQTRRDCRAEAKSKGLRRLSKARRDFMRECKAAGGENVDFMSEQSDFAFNGYGDF